MVFSEFKYERPNMAKVKAKGKAIVKNIKKAKSYAEVKDCVDALNKLNNHVTTMGTLVEIRHTIDTKDAFYEKEQAFFDTEAPKLMPVTLAYYQALLASPFVKELEADLGKHFIEIAELQVRSMNKKLIVPMIQQNKLTSRYQKLIASCSVELLGEKRNLSGLSMLMQSTDRETRKLAYDAYAGFFAEHEAELDEIYDKLVKLRDGMGRKMGFDNFIPLAYLNMGRVDYNAEDVKKFREQVARDLVPVCHELREAQKARIGVDKIRYYDESLLYPDGNAKPNGTREEMQAQALAMYKELSKDTGEFFQMMCSQELMDLETKPGKAAGGYCTFLPDYNVPFIFSNFNGTSADVDVLTHEAGHAFQAYCTSKCQSVPEYLFGSSETAEIHSMSMEFFTYPWMDKFFGDAAEKYKKLHTTEGLTFVPYGVCVDEFQHRVYEKPNMTPAERKAVWKELEEKYLPDRDYDGKEIFEKGGFYFQKLHIFMYPFYYIDYTLASMAAFEFYGKMKEDRESAWKDYRRLCDLGGSRAYRELLKEAHLCDPFVEGSVKKAMQPLVDFVKA